MAPHWIIALEPYYRVLGIIGWGVVIWWLIRNRDFKLHCQHFTIRAIQDKGC